MNRSIQWLVAPIVLFTALTWLSCRAAAPRPERGYAGTWVMTLGDRVFIVLTIEPKGDGFTVRTQAPSSFSLPAASSPLRYSNIQLPITDRRSTRAAVENDHLHIVIEDPANPTEPDEYDLTLKDADHASLQMKDVPVAPMPLTRHVGPPPAPATDWDPKRVYGIEPEIKTPNAEMATIYDEDQKVRQKGPMIDADWDAIAKTDQARRQRVAALLAAGALHTADDYRKAAFVFQHGDRPEDYLLAHTLALMAVAKGDQGATWIAAATLDRYLQSVHQPQIYGTQFLGAGAAMTQQPYNEQLISDALRTELGVPTRASQAEQLKAFQSQTPGK